MKFRFGRGGDAADSTVAAAGARSALEKMLVPAEKLVAARARPR